MSEEKTITIGHYEYTLPFDNFGYDVVDEEGLDLARDVESKAVAQAIADALNFRYVEFPAMVEKMQRLMANAATNEREAAYHVALEVFEGK